MKILVDADALPHDLRDLIYRTAERTSIPVVLVGTRISAFLCPDMFLLKSSPAGSMPPTTGLWSGLKRMIW